MLPQCRGWSSNQVLCCISWSADMYWQTSFAAEPSFAGVKLHSSSLLMHRLSSFIHALVLLFVTLSAKGSLESLTQLSHCWELIGLQCWFCYCSPGHLDTMLSNSLSMLLPHTTYPHSLQWLLDHSVQHLSTSFLGHTLVCVHWAKWTGQLLVSDDLVCELNV